MKFAMSGSRAGAAGLLAGGLVFAVLNAVHMLARPKTVPVLSRMVPAGARVTPGDFVWVSAAAADRVSRAAVTDGYANETLYPGEMPTPALVGTRPGAAVAIAVTPRSAADMTVASVGGRVNILVLQPDGRVWQSGPVTVVSAPRGSGSLIGGQGGSVEVIMSPKLALAYEQHQVGGTVVLEGVGS